MSEIDVSKCIYYHEYPSNDIECNSALEGDNCRKVCSNRDCKWSLCDENEYCEYKFNWKLQQLKAENEELKEVYCNGLDEYKICRSLQNAEHRIYELETALDEIEEIIIKRQKEHYCYCDECSPFKEILQKIKEVRNG